MRKLSRINETHWGGMVRRSSGEVVRKQDEVKPEYFPKTRKELKGIIWDIYKGSTDVLDVRIIDVRGVGDLSNIFQDFAGVKTIDLTGWDTSNCFSMSSMFSGCEDLEEIIGIEKLQTGNVKKMEDVFYDCERLKTIDISEWNVGSVETTGYMFAKCINLKSLDLGKWKPSNLENANGMFLGCMKLETLDVSGWDVGKLENGDFMFSGLKMLKKIDVTGWRPVELTAMDSMFAFCDSLEDIDLSGWELKYYEPSCGGMFKGCPENVKWVLDGNRFKHAVDETHWGGMVKRSSGDVTRKEEWMNTLKRCEFYDWLKKNYATYYGRNIILGREGNTILVPITGQRSPMYMYLIYDNDKLVDIYYYSTNKSLSISLSDKFDVRYDDKDLTHISSKDGKVNNETVIEIIDMLPDLVTRPAIVRKDGLNETHWGGMVRRSSGNVKRKEDELDAMSLENFKDYLETIYEPVKKGLEILLHHPDSKMDMCILVPYAESRRGAPYYFHYNGKRIWTFDFGGQGVITQRLKDKFDVEIDEKDLTHVSLGGEVSNSLFIDVIDFLLDVVANPALKRKVNETHWGGMVKRSSGAVVRKQDELDDDTRRCLDDYIEGFITLCCDGYDVIEPTFDEFMEYINNGKGEGDDEYIDTLLKYVPYNWDKRENIERKILNGLQ